MLLAALVSLLAALGPLWATPGALLVAFRGSGLGTLSFTLVWGLGSCETSGFTVVLGHPGREFTWGVAGCWQGFWGRWGDYRGEDDQ